MGRRAISNTFCVNTIEDGQRGKVGRFYYYAGEFNKNNTTTRFKVTDAQAPFFHHLESGQDRYHVYNPEKNPTTVNSDLSMFDMWKESGNGNWNNGSWNNAPWVAMTNDFKFLITEALFSEFAHLGGAIINGTWMLSQHGTINGSASSDYEEFDPDHPNENYGGSNFVPNYCVDLLTGKTYQQEAYIMGAIHAQSLSTEFLDVSFGNGAEYYVNWDETTGQLKDSVFWNYRCSPTGTPASLDIYLPTNQFAYFGQRVIIYNTGYGLGTGQTVTIYSAEVQLGQLPRFRPLVGIALDAHSGSTPLPANSFTPVKDISFVNGIVELVCVPPIYSETGILCDWAVVNIGTNYYHLDQYIPYNN